MGSELSAHHRALAAFVTEHREQLEAFAESEHETAWVATAILAWARENAQAQEERL